MMRVFLVLAILWLAVAGARADGKAYATSGKPVGIPYQRAVIVFEDGIQTLAIQNSLTEGGDLNWVVPVPSRETEFVEYGLYALPKGDRPTRVDLDAMESKRFDREFRSEAFKASATAANLKAQAIWMAGLALLFLFIAVRGIRGKGSNLTAAAAYLLVGLVSIFLSPPVLMQSKSAANNVEVLRTLESDRVRADLITGSDASALREWLKENNTPLPPQDEPILAEYIRDGWSFAAIKLKVRSEAEGAPAPLLLRFPTPEPVYPMRLTSTATDRLVLDLAVWQRDAPLGTEGAQLLHAQPANRPRLLASDGDARGWTSRMRGIYTAEQMRADDLRFHALPTESVQTELKSPEGEAWNTVVKALYPFLILMPVLALMPLPRRRSLGDWMLAALAVAAVSLPFTPIWPRSNPGEPFDILAITLVYMFPLAVLLMGWLGSNQPPEDAPARLRLALGLPLVVGVILALHHLATLGPSPMLMPDGSIANLPPIERLTTR